MGFACVLWPPRPPCVSGVEHRPHPLTGHAPLTPAQRNMQRRLASTTWPCSPLRQCRRLLVQITLRGAARRETSTLAKFYPSANQRCVPFLAVRHTANTSWQTLSTCSWCIDGDRGGSRESSRMPLLWSRRQRPAHSAARWLRQPYTEYNEERRDSASASNDRLVSEASAVCEFRVAALSSVRGAQNHPRQGRA